MPQFVRVVVGQQSLHARGNGVEVGVLRFLKVDIGEYLFHLRCERNFPKHYVLPQSFLACFALQPLIVNDRNNRLCGQSIHNKSENRRVYRLCSETRPKTLCFRRIADIPTECSYPSETVRRSSSAYLIEVFLRKG